MPPAIKYCGPQGFGPYSLVNPFDVTPCFQETLNILLIFIFSISLISTIRAIRKTSIPFWQIKKKVKVSEDMSSFYAIRFMLSIVLFVLNFAVLAYLAFHTMQNNYMFYQGRYSIPSYSAIISATLSLLFSGLTVYICQYMIEDSVTFTLATFWTTIILLDMSRLRTLFDLANINDMGSFLNFKITSRRNNTPVMASGGILIIEFFFLCLVSIPLHSWTTIKRTPSMSPEQHASFISRIFFFWAWPLLQKGWKGSLEIEDIFDLKQVMTAGVLQDIYENSWKTEFMIVTTKTKSVTSSMVEGVISFFVAIFKFFGDSYQFVMSFFMPAEMTQAQLQAQADKETRAAENKKAIFLVKVLFRAFGWEYLGAGALRIVIIVFTFFTPQLMTALLSYIQYNSAEAQAQGFPPQPKSLGMSIVICMIVINLINLALSSMFTWICDMATYKARSALMTEIYRKSLRLKTPMNAGEVVNRFSNDTSAVTGAFSFLHLVWSAPIEIAVALYLLYQILGPSSFAALATSIVIGLISYLAVPYLVKKSELMMAINDKRMNLLAGTMTYAQTIKMYGWEGIFVKKITDARNEQLKELGGVLLISAFIGGLVSSAVSLIILSTLALYALTAPSDKPLDLARIFVGMSLLNTLQSPLNTLSGAYSQILQLSVSFRRLAEILCAEEIDPDQGNEKLSPGNPCAVSIRSATFTTFSETNPSPILQNVNLDIPSGKLTAIVGPTGCGKSCLMNVISGGTFLMKPGGFLVRNSTKTAYVPQTPWLFNGTVRENILFFSDYEVEWYKTVVAACSLKTDFDSLKGKDMAFLTDGSNLSGGQKQRISLARAVYSHYSDILLLDDPLSAVDARVSAHIFEKVMSRNGIVPSKTRVVTTNRLDLLSQFDHVIVMGMGTVIGQGTYQELVTMGSPEVKQFLASQQHAQVMMQQQQLEHMDPRMGLRQRNKRDSEMSAFEQFNKNPTRRYKKVGSMTNGRSTLERMKNKKKSQKDRLEMVRQETAYETIDGTLTRRRQPMTPTYIASADIRNAAFNEIVDDEEEDRKNMEESEKHKVVADEMTVRGRLPYNLYWYYIKSCSYFLAFMVVILLFANLGLDAWNELWLQRWGTSNTGKNSSSNFLYLGVFTAGSIGGAFLNIILDLVAIRFMALKASKKLHERALVATMAAPITFFHANPAGRIINRFSNDIMGLDRTIPKNLLSLINSLLAASMSIAMACIASNMVIGIVAFVGVLYWFLVNYFMRSVRELRRLVLTSQSPTFTFLKESMDGIPTIRGFGKEKTCQLKMEALIDTNSKVFYSTFAASSWLSTNIQFLSLMITIPVLFSVVNSTSGSSGLMAVALTNALSISSTLQGIVQAYISMEISLVSIERVKEYIDRVPESAMRHSTKFPVTPEPNWPSRGEIEFINYSTTYNPDREDAPNVLNNLTLTFEAGQRIAIVGRTGAGKSSMVLALFQLLEAKTGGIKVDGIDLGSVDLQTVRSRMAIIPQQAMCYPGSIRENLDPAMVYSDQELWNSLQLVGMSEFVASLPQPTPDSNPLDGRFPGELLSMGQMQLFCLCRAILLKSKIIVLDEPTSNLDHQTDAHIQGLIRTIFKGCTVITIAHRIATIQDYDQILVLEQGQVKEYGNPQKLLRNPESAFAKLANGTLE